MVPSYKTKKFSLDAMDYFLIGLLITNFLTRKFFLTLAEKEKDEAKQVKKLANSMIAKSRSFCKRIKVSNPKQSNYWAKMKQVWSFQHRFLEMRGGPELESNTRGINKFKLSQNEWISCPRNKTSGASKWCSSSYLF